ncbi:hypothetical protein IAU59_000564 [Kwoniella sp. CBS 9459]
MGVKDLLRWVKTNHSEAIVTYPSRWASPEFKGKKIAIDATLLTNRYHFASRDGPLKEKGEILGWYNLISEMRAHGVKPVAIWDERGPREWKAPEARRRLTVRAGHLIRRNREIERSSRLHSLREVLHDFNAMSEEEQAIVREHWEMTRFMFVRPKEDVEEVEEIATTTKQETTEAKVLEEPAILEEMALEHPEGPSGIPEEPLSTTESEKQPADPTTTDHPTPERSSDITHKDFPAPPEPVEGSTTSLANVAAAVTATLLSPVIIGAAAVSMALQATLPPKPTAPEPIPPPLPPKPESITGGPPKSSQLVSTLSEADDATVNRITSMIDTLAPLIQEYRDARQPSGYRVELEPDEMSVILSDGMVEMAEDLREEWIVTPPSTTAAEGASTDGRFRRDREERVEEIDETLACLISPNKVPETPSQMALTKAEGEIINDILSPPSSPIMSPANDFEEIHKSATPDPSSYLAPSISEAEAEAEADLPEPLKRLDELIEAAPSVKSTYDRALNIPSAADHEDCKELLQAMGVPVLEAKIPYEAEGLASALARRGLVDYVGTEDSDVLAYEGPLLRHLSPATQPLSLISGESLRQRMGLTSSQYLDFLILLGTDASPRIPKVGPVTAFKLITKHGSIEQILKQEKGVADRVIDLEGFMEMVNNARKVFTELPPTDMWEARAGAENASASGERVGNELLEESAWDEGEVEKLLEEKHGIKLVEVQTPSSH